MLLTEIKQAVTDNWVDSISDALFARRIAMAVQEYSRWNPLPSEETLTTVLDENTYEMPDNCIGVRDVFLSPAGAIATQPSDLMGEDEYYRMPSHRVINDINMDEYLTSIEMHANYVPPRSVVLDPTPGISGLEVLVRYWALHEINLAGTGYDTIPDEDLGIIRDMVLIELMKAKMLSMALEPDYAEGQERETFHFIADNAERVRAQLINTVSAKYGGGVALAY
jgi:hypothetical protein